ncbi:MAG: hypothetical protein JO347_13165, partial [Candidatus Eremiobacteraeota bacterium]|nr:hypothetical protein [Candidatus Eremiobacteraeota bacterium]
HDDVRVEPSGKDALAPPEARAMVEELAATADANGDRATLAAATTKDSLVQLGAKHGVKGRALYRPIRIAATGEEHGVELPILLPLLGSRRLAARIRSALTQV